MVSSTGYCRPTSGRVFASSVYRTYGRLRKYVACQNSLVCIWENLSPPSFLLIHPVSPASDEDISEQLDEWWAQGGGGGRGGGCFGGDFGDDAATLARAAQWRRENPDLAVRQAEFFHSLWDDPGGAVAKEELLALGLSPDYRHECGICDRDYMLRRGCPCCRD